jgi:outer membrane lipoprotein-sorting protein
MKKISLLTTVIVFLAVLSGCAGTGNKALTANDLFETHVETVYGDVGIGSVESFTMKGTLFVDDFGIEAPIEIVVKAPSSSLFKTNVMGSDIAEGCHEGVCWSQQFGQGVQALEGEALAFRQQQSDFYQFQNIDRYYETLTIVEPEAGKETNEYQVKATKANGKEDIYYFSKETGLLTGTVLQAATAMGNDTASTQNNNYKEFNGVLMATELLQSSGMGNSRIVIDDITFGNVDDSVFSQPD